MVGASDVYHWLEEGARPSHPPPSVPEALLFARNPAKRFGWKPSRWALAELTLRLHRSLLGRHEVKERAGAWFAAARRMRAEATEVRSTLPDSRILLSHFEQHFRRAVSRAQAHADRVLVLRQPWFDKDYTAEERARFWHGGAGKPWKEKVTTYFSLEVVNQLLSQVDACVVTIADSLGVPHLDLRPLLNDGSHYYDHDHYTAAGAAIVAAAVAAALIRRTSPEPPPRIPSATQTTAPSPSGRW